MNVLIGCECTAVLREAFAARGHNAWSCDLLPSLVPGKHIQGDLLDHLDGCYLGHGKPPQPWDLLIFHPDCTYLTVSAAWAFKDGPYHMKLKPGTLTGIARREARDKAVGFVKKVFSSDIARIGAENPIGNLSSLWRKPDQIIQPYQFGDDASKGTCLWLKALPRLIVDPANRFPGRLITNKSNGKTVERWSNQTDGGQNKLTPSDDRWLKRATTYPGIAAAMAAQWGALARRWPHEPYWSQGGNNANGTA